MAAQNIRGTGGRCVLSPVIPFQMGGKQERAYTPERAYISPSFLGSKLCFLLKAASLESSCSQVAQSEVLFPGHARSPGQGRTRPVLRGTVLGRKVPPRAAEHKHEGGEEWVPLLWASQCPPPRATLQDSQQTWPGAGSLFSLDFKMSQRGENRKDLERTFFGENWVPCHHPTMGFPWPRSESLDMFPAVRRPRGQALGSCRGG